MKPKAAAGRGTVVAAARAPVVGVGESMAAGPDDYDEVSLEKAYETVGLLITESRLPNKSQKGRRDGEHIPQSNAASTHKECSDESEECNKVQRYRETMSSLCRNRIPLCIEVLLCPTCEMTSGSEAAGSGEEQATSNAHSHSHDVGSAHSNSYVLLEQWTIQQVHTRSDSKPQSLQNLCNAVRSHLCFSQLSAWLQVSQGISPKHIFYRLTAPGEWFVHKFVMSPQSHKFPDAGLGRSRYALRVTLSSLPRTTLTPQEISIANRDQLFAVKDASPLLRKSRSSFTSVSKLSPEAEDGTVSDRLQLTHSVTPNERTHTRSKSVRGLQDLAGRKSPPVDSVSRKAYTAQRCLNLTEDTSLHGASAEPPPPATQQEGLSAAEKLAAFSALPTNSINKLELISCASGFSPSKTPPPNRLPLTSQRHFSLKSPKVLFTRTSVYNKDNFFPIPSLDSTADLTSELSTDNESDLETDGSTSCQLMPVAVRSKVTRPRFDISDEEDGETKKNHLHQSNLQDASTILSGLKLDEDSQTSPEMKDLVSKLSSFISQTVTSNYLTSIECSQAPSTLTADSPKNHSVDNGHTKIQTKLTANADPIVDSQSSQSGIKLPSENSAQEISIKNSPQDSTLDHCTTNGNGDSSGSRRSRLKERNSVIKGGPNSIIDTPLNKKIQSIKQSSSHPLASRSRLFKQRPLQSSPAPVKRIGKNNFGYDENLSNTKAIKNAISCTSLTDHDDSSADCDRHNLTLSSSAPTFSSSRRSTPSQSHSSLLGNFEESLLNGRIDPAGVVEGFTVDIGASGSFCPKHVSLPVDAYFFNSWSDDDAPSPYLGYVDLSQVTRRGYQIPRKGTLQITLFYPNHKVNKMFVVTYDLMDMPARSQTFIRQKTVYAPCDEKITPNTPNHQLLERQNSSEGGRKERKLPTYLRYLIHLRFRSTKTNKVYLHTDIRLIYARDKFEFDSRVASYELRSFIESPSNPKYSPLK